MSPRDKLLLAIPKILKHDELQDTFTQLTDKAKVIMKNNVLDHPVRQRLIFIISDI